MLFIQEYHVQKVSSCDQITVVTWSQLLRQLNPPNSDHGPASIPWEMEGQSHPKFGALIG